MAKSIHKLLWIWLNLRPSESPSIPCSIEWCGKVDHLPNRKKPTIPYTVKRWVEVDKDIQLLSESEKYRLYLYLSGKKNGRLPQKLSMKLKRLFRFRGLI